MVIFSPAVIISVGAVDNGWSCVAEVACSLDTSAVAFPFGSKPRGSLQDDLITSIITNL